MKATGVIRRIDNLGRIVIPKEIRKNLRIHEGENLEIYVDKEGNIILRKHSIMKKMNDLASDFTDSIFSFINHDVIITDRDKVIAVTGKKKKEYLNKTISDELLISINRREDMLETHKKPIKIIDETLDATYALSTIVCNGDAVGIVIIFSEQEIINENDYKIVKITSKFLSKYLEE